VAVTLVGGASFSVAANSSLSRTGNAKQTADHHRR